MKNSKTTISASEINKYTYCPFQWYYERLYGTKELRDRYKARNEALGLSNTTYSHFAKGLAHHASFSKNRGRKARIFGLILLLVFILLLALYFIQWEPLISLGKWLQEWWL